MAQRSEEDYLDSLLKSISVNAGGSLSQDLFSTTSDMKVPETFEVSAFENTDDEVYKNMLFENSSDEASMDAIMEAALNPLRTKDQGGAASVEPDDEINDGNMSESGVDADAKTGEADDEEDEAKEEQLVDEYIQKVLAQDDTDFENNQEDEALQGDATLQGDETLEELVDTAINRLGEDSKETESLEEKSEDKQEEDQTQYIDLTNEYLDETNDLLGKMEDIFNDVQDELAEEESHTDSVPQEDSAEKINIDDVPMDDELKGLLGLDEAQSEQDAKDLSAVGLSQDELEKINAMEKEAQADETMDPVPEVYEEEDENIDVGLQSLLSMVGDAGVDLKDMEDELSDDSATGEDPSEMIGSTDLNQDILGNQDESALKGEDLSEKKPGSDGAEALEDHPGIQALNGKKPGIISRLMSIFKKKEHKKTAEDASENQQVLDELFDENGELIEKPSKKKKFGLFPKKTSESNAAVEIPIGDDLEDGEDADGASREKKKEKKEKKKKEPKPKKEKPKKEKKVKPKKAPKPKKPKAPVDPSEIIKIKPVGLLIMVLFIAGVVGYTYFFITTFSYNQSFDRATYYMLDKRYSYAYNEMIGVEPKKEEDVLLQRQIKVIMYVQRKYDAYKRYVQMNMPVEALDALIQGVVEFDINYEEAETLGVAAELTAAKQQIVETLITQYGITEEMARIYAAIEDYGQYQSVLESYGGRLDDSDN